MANKKRGYVKIECLDKPRTIRFSLNSLELIEEKIGVALENMDSVPMTIKNVKILLWCGLVHEDEALTEKEVGEMVDLSNLQEVQEKMAEAFQLTQPKKA